MTTYTLVTTYLSTIRIGNRYILIIHSAENFHKVPNPRWPPLKMTDNCYFAPDMVGNITVHYNVISKYFMREDMSY